MENKKYSSESCSNCGELAGTYKIQLEPLCDCCAEEQGQSLIVEVTKTCLNCGNAAPVELATLELIEHINRHLEEMEIAHE
jgi:hypothetical protein